MTPSPGIGAAFLAAPVVGVIVYLVISSNQQADTQQQLEQVKHELRQERFDREFDAAWKSMGVRPDPAVQQPNEREAALVAKRDELEAEAQRQREKAKATAEEIEAAARAAAQAQQMEQTR